MLISGSRATWKSHIRNTATHRSELPKAVKFLIDLTQESVPETVYTCLHCPAECAAFFVSQKALETHKQRAHSSRKLAKLYIGANSQCPCCLKDYNSPPASHHPLATQPMQKCDDMWRARAYQR